MGQIRDGCATTAHAIRAAIQRSQASNAELSRELGINVKTVAKWRKRNGVQDAAMGPKQAQSSVPSIDEKGVIVAFRRHPQRSGLVMLELPPRPDRDTSIANARPSASTFMSAS
jgi:hypothetical protein